MEILKTGALVKHRFSWPVMSAAAVLSIAITAAPGVRSSQRRSDAEVSLRKEKCHDHEKRSREPLSRHQLA
jgi:hypothetical protein